MISAKQDSPGRQPGRLRGGTELVGKLARREPRVTAKLVYLARSGLYVKNRAIPQRLPDGRLDYLRMRGADRIGPAFS